jgi:lysophospholipase L1-like esterase
MILNRSGRANAISQFPNSKISQYLKFQMPTIHHTYLALGDSYTIGEGLPVYENFPYQTIQLLRKSGLSFYAAEIIAKTGWTTDELQAGMQATQFLSSYDIVSLCIGVNNQYRGRNVEEYQLQFESLLQQAIQLAGNNSQHVFVLSIPDWGVTPFAKDRDSAAIAQAIDAYNAINKMVAGQYAVNYIDITPGTRLAKDDSSLLATDQLHPSGKEYERWAKQLCAGITTVIK